MRVIVLFFIIFMMSVQVVAQTDTCQPASGEPLLIGAIFPPTTLLNSEAAAPYEGIAAMVDVINACGGVEGRPVELVYAPAANSSEAEAALALLQGDVTLIVGSGLTVISEVLTAQAGADSFFYWEVSEALDNPHPYALSPRPNNVQLGMQAAAFVESEVVNLLPVGQSLNVGLIHEDRARAVQIADGVSAILSESPAMREVYATRETNGYRLALRAREEAMNVIILAAFETGADRLWYDMREADANLAAWVQVGGDQYRRDICYRIGNTDSLISVSAVGAVAEAYRQDMLGSFYNRYRGQYMERFGRLPGERAHLAASGMYLLLRAVLPGVEGDYTTQNIQQASQTTHADIRGLMGDYWDLDTERSVNRGAVAIFQQQQQGEFCTIAPESAVTCALPLQSFPTWRDRVRLLSC